jgi:hypothetical protein
MAALTLSCRCRESGTCLNWIILDMFESIFACASHVNALVMLRGVVKFRVDVLVGQELRNAGRLFGYWSPLRAHGGLVCGSSSGSGREA